MKLRTIITALGRRVASALQASLPRGVVSHATGFLDHDIIKSRSGRHVFQRLCFSIMVVFLSTALLLWYYVGLAIARVSPSLQRSTGLNLDSRNGTQLSGDVSSCPGLPLYLYLYSETLRTDHMIGYSLTSLKNTEYGLTADLSLAGEACNAFGLDISNLTIEVTYESQTRWV